MSGQRRNGTAFVNLTIAKKYNGSAFVDLSTAKRFDGTAWHDLLSIDRTYSAAATRSFNDGTKRGVKLHVGIYYYAPPVNIHKWASDTGLAQGRYATDLYSGLYTACSHEEYFTTSWPSPLDEWAFSSNELPCWGVHRVDFSHPQTYDGPWYGLISFGNGAGKPTELAGKTIDAAYIYLHRYPDSTGSSSSVNNYLYATNHTSVPGASATSPHAEVTGSAYLIGGLTKGSGAWFELPVALAQVVVAGKCICLYHGNNDSTRLYGIESTNKPKIRIICH